MNNSHLIVGFGNPLLDMSTTIIEGSLDDLLTKHNLEPDGQKEINVEEFNEILEILKSEKCEISCNPGGSTLNTLRILQALGQQPSSSVFLGGLGNDREGEIIETEVEKNGVEARYARHSSFCTGRVIALINGENRSLLAHLGAAEHYSLEDLKTQENIKLFREVSLAYIEGFFITHSFEVGLEIVHLCKTNGVALVLNISGVYVVEKYPKEILSMASAADFVIGNINEFKALAKVVDLKYDDTIDLAFKVHSKLWPEGIPTQNFKLEQMKQFGKSVVVTQGKSHVHCVYGRGSLITYEVPFLNPALVKDSTGAGDAFAAGFITSLLKNGFLNSCLDSGCKIAQQVIQHIGVQPKKLSLSF